MIFKNYCAVFFNPVDKLNGIVGKIAEDSPRVMKGKGISIYTFVSVVDSQILTEYFKSYDLNFFMFNLDPTTSGFNFVDKEKEMDLFGFLHNDKTSDSEKLANALMDDIINNNVKSESIPGIRESGRSKPYIVTDKNDDLDEILNNIENMTKSERNLMLNEIIDKGVDNLDDTDKLILKRISELQ